MCGRYGVTKPEIIRAAFKKLEFEETLKPRYNVSPTQAVAIAKNDGRHRIELARWGLVPTWAKSLESQKIQPINAKAETLADSRMFAPLFRNRRCIILADAFYEWRNEGKKKLPVCFRIKGGQPFAFAGLWDRWHDELTSCTIITGEPNELVAPVHNRMPVMLDPDDAMHWIAEDATPDELAAMLRPYPADLMESFAVSPDLNSSRADRPELMDRQPS